jgi:hypothetical protein
MAEPLFELSRRPGGTERSDPYEIEPEPICLGLDELFEA